jgi:hypothetical protein
MTTFAELITSVQTVTLRQDNEARERIILALKKAIIKEHSALDYPRDLVTITVTPTVHPTKSDKYVIDLSALGFGSRVRKIKSLEENKADPAKIVFKEVAIDNLYDSYSAERFNYYYRAGSQLVLSPVWAIDSVDLSFYVLPQLTNTELYSDWMADMYDYVLYTHAAAEIFRLIGKSDEYQMQLNSIAENRMDIIKNEISGVG